MTITELYNKRTTKTFQGSPYRESVLFPWPMYVYDPAKEYEVDQEILHIKDRLHRPTNYLDVMVMDIFEVS
ncbi:MAG: hypothetical protein R2791_12375 [Saprospiraceae bacterium]